MQEFKVIDAAVSIDQLRMRLKDNELEQYGEAFIPDFVYDVIRRLSRFSSMRVRSIPIVHQVQTLNMRSGGTSKMLKNFLVSFWKSYMMNVQGQCMVEKRTRTRELRVRTVR